MAKALSKSRILIPDETRIRIAEYEQAVLSGHARPGARLVEALSHKNDFTTALLRTKLPQIFAESVVAGDGTDWNLTELGLLGDISVAMGVTVFDDGRHTAPEVFGVPFEAGLVFVPGALLRSGGPAWPADWYEVVDSQDQIDPDAFDGLYARRLLPGFRWIDARAQECAQLALVTLPGSAAVSVAGPFCGRLGAHLERIWSARCAVPGQLRFASRPGTAYIRPTIALQMAPQVVGYAHRLRRKIEFINSSNGRRYRVNP
jgi:hypothetical protein